MSENPYPPSAQKGMSHMTNQTVVEKIADYIENHLEEDIPLDKIAKELNYSKFYIARVFADNTGYTIYKYIQGRRLTLAARKLAETDKPIVEIAYEARYGSQQAFTLAFSQFYLCKFRVSHKSISFFFQFADKHIQTFLQYQGKRQHYHHRIRNRSRRRTVYDDRRAGQDR